MGLIFLMRFFNLIVRLRDSVLQIIEITILIFDKLGILIFFYEKNNNYKKYFFKKLLETVSYLSNF